MDHTEQKIKHLEFIQTVIGRMGQNSFLIKGWCITLVSALYALAAKDANLSYVLVSYIAVPAFWVLDGYFIAMERRYVALYKDVAGHSIDVPVDFNLDVVGHNVGRARWSSGIFSKTLLVFYPVIIGIALLIMFVLSIIGHLGGRTCY
jgi:hypothetical protein